MAEPTIKKGSDFLFSKIYSGNGTGQKVGQFVPFEESGTISNSLVFNGSSDTLTRTLGAGNQKIWTLSVWIKRSGLGAGRIISRRTGAGSTAATLGFNSTNQFEFYDGSYSINLFTNRSFENRDRWYHIYVRFEASNGTPADRFQVYVDGEKQTFTTASTLSDANGNFNSASAHGIGYYYSNNSDYFDGYMAEFNWIDGTNPAVSTFGLTDTSTGRWIPKTLSGITYGTNGFRLTFSDSSSDAAIGTDSSTNSNTWTLNGTLSASSQKTNSPTNNIPTMYEYDPDLGASFLSHGGTRIRYSGTNVGYPFIHGINPNSGKWYAEVRSKSDSGGSVYSFGCYNIEDLKYYSSGNYWNGYQVSNGDGSGAGCFLQNDNNGFLVTSRFSRSVSQGSTTKRSAAGAVYGIALDLDNRIMTTYDNDGSEIGKAEIPPGPVSFAATAVDTPSNDGWDWNFGDNGTFNGQETAGGNSDADGNGNFYHSVPSGYKMLIEENMADPGIPRPDLVWIKNRDSTDSNQLYDSSRGPQKDLQTDATNQETTTYDGLQKFMNGGFEIEDDVSVNTDSEGYVAWNWICNGGTTSANTDSTPDLASTIQANQTAGFSIVQWTGDSGQSTVAHGLSSAPEIVIQKNLDSTSNWWFYTTAIDGSYDYLKLDTTDGKSDYAQDAPTNTLFTSHGWGSTSMIAYCWHSVDGFSKFGSYSGNGNADGTFVYTGFKPSWVMMKNISDGDSYADWAIFDNARSPTNEVNATLRANLTNVELTTNKIDMLSNGFKLRGTGTRINESGDTFIYMAFAEHPFIGSGSKSPVTAR